MRAMILPVVLIGALVGASASRVQAQVPATTTQKPTLVRASDALERVTWRTRTLVGDNRLTQWKLAVPSTGVGLPDTRSERPGTFLEAVVRADAAIVNFIEGANYQRVSPQVQKNLDASLTAEEIADLKSRMGEVRFAAYRVDGLPSDPEARRRIVAFAKSLGADVLVVPAGTSVAGLAQIAEQVQQKVAVMIDATSAAATTKALTGLSTGLHVGIDITRGVNQEALNAIGNRLAYVRVGGAGMTENFFHDLSRRNVRPLVMTLDTAGVVKTPGDLFAVVDAFEAAVQPAYGDYFTEFSKKVATRRDLARPGRDEKPTEAELQKRSGDALAKIRAAIPAKPYATPKKPRKLLVVESLHGMSHDTIPHANVMLEEMGKITGAWTTEFNNDLNVLKYPKIAEYDGVFLNSIVGEFAAEPEVRDGLARFVREGGGMGGIHGTPWASRNWDEFAEMIGSQSAPHRIEQGIMKVYDPASPLMKPFGGKDLPFREEYYRFEHEGRGRLRWEKVRVLMTVALDDPTIEPRPWNGYKRPDNVYPVSWIRTYGKGRVFYSSLGHMPETFMDPALVGHFFAGVQYLLGDLEADATPNPLTRTTAQPVASTQKPPAVPSVSQRPNGTSLGTIRVGAADNNQWFGWRVAMPSIAIKGLTLSEALARADAHPIAVTSVIAAANQTVSAEVPKPLDYRLQPGERNAVVYRLRELNQQIAGYVIPNLGPDAATRRHVFEFAKAINIPLILTNDSLPIFAELDALAEEFGINVAFQSRYNLKQMMSTLEGRSKRLGIAADLEGWMEAGIKPVEGLAIVKDRLLAVRAVDRSAPGDGGRAVPVGEGAAALDQFFLAAYKAGVRPLTIMVGRINLSEADYMKDINGFERVMWPAMAERVRTMLATDAGKIRGPERLDAAMRTRIETAAPKQVIAKPRKTRKLLVTDIQMYSGHGTIPHGNLLLELIARNTGAFEPVFSNDLNLLKYPKIKEFDAIYMNNVCGMVWNDPEVRDGVLRFVREGGGIGGHHAVTYANNNWPEFAEMMGGWAGAHRIEKQLVKIDDGGSPLTKMFGSASFEHTDEFYIFPPFSPYSREKQRVLLSIDVEKSDRASDGRFCGQCTRPDQDYGLAWIRTYGKGRAYFTPLGHTNIFYTDPRWTQHVLAAIQYILGDLDADATPSKARGTQ